LPFAAPRFSNERLVELFRQLLSIEPRDHIHRPARRQRHDGSDTAVRIFFGVRMADKKKCGRSSSDYHSKAPVHRIPPRLFQLSIG
jgi:hypothetical protein